MNEIWANRLIAGTQTWDKVPASRKVGVENALRARVEQGQISAERFEKITGNKFEQE